MMRAGSRRVLRFLVVAIVAAGCSNPRRSAGLTLASGAEGSGAGVLSGTVVAYGTNTPVSGATVRLGGAASVSNSTGQFTLTNVAESGSGVATVALPGYVYRGVALSLAHVRTGVTLDVLRDAAPFSLDFYRQIARNSGASSTLLPTARWTVAPSFYFQRLTVDTGLPVPDQIIQAIQANFALSVPEIAGGRFNVAASVVGDGPRAAQDGWVNVTFYTVIPTGSLGNASVGGNSGTMVIRYDPALVSNGSTNPYNCSSIALQAADYLITSTMGFYQTVNAIVDEFSGPGCPGVGRPANTVYHTALMYSRPVGNIDPDVDPVSSAHAFASTGAARPVVVYDVNRIGRR
jgi:hypothetical protein